MIPANATEGRVEMHVLPLQVKPAGAAVPLLPQSGDIGAPASAFLTHYLRLDEASEAANAEPVAGSDRPGSPESEGEAAERGAAGRHLRNDHSPLNDLAVKPGV